MPVAGDSFEARCEGFPTGLVGTIGVRILDNVGGTTTARVTAGVIEDPAGSGSYVATLVAPSVAGEYSIEWDDPSAPPPAFEDLLVTIGLPPGGLIVDPAELVLLLDVDEDRAAALALLTTRAVAAHLHPLEVPDPLPAPIQIVGLRLAARLNRADPNTSSSIVSETIGSYTYRLSGSLPLDVALQVPEDLVKELAPWAPVGRRRVYDVDTTGCDALFSQWPSDWWQRDADNPDPEVGT